MIALLQPCFLLRGGQLSLSLVPRLLLHLLQANSLNMAPHPQGKKVAL